MKTRLPIITHVIKWSLWNVNEAKYGDTVLLQCSVERDDGRVVNFGARCKLHHGCLLDDNHRYYVLKPEYVNQFHRDQLNLLFRYSLEHWLRTHGGEDVPPEVRSVVLGICLNAPCLTSVLLQLAPYGFGEPACLAILELYIDPNLLPAVQDDPTYLPSA